MEFAVISSYICMTAPLTTKTKSKSTTVHVAQAVYFYSLRSGKWGINQILWKGTYSKVKMQAMYIIELGE